jgi:hypothetical protein
LFSCCVAIRTVSPRLSSCKSNSDPFIALLNCRNTPQQVSNRLQPGTTVDKS